jgi:hypothetical protein
MNIINISIFIIVNSVSCNLFLLVQSTVFLDLRAQAALKRKT